MDHGNSHRDRVDREHEDACAHQRQRPEHDVTDGAGHVTHQARIAGSAGQQISCAASVQHTDGQPHNVVGEIGAQPQHDPFTGSVQPKMCQRLQRKLSDEHDKQRDDRHGIG